MLHAIRPHCHGQLHVVFGCGGDRDGGKRPQMGAIAASHADTIIVTDDNPREQDAATIRDAVMAGIASTDQARTQNIGGRREAIAAALKNLGPGDILVVAGKGHEQGQIIGNTVIPFDDVTEVKTLIAQMNKREEQTMPPAQTPLWTRAEIEEALANLDGGATIDSDADFMINGIAIDSRAVTAGDLFCRAKAKLLMATPILPVRSRPVQLLRLSTKTTCAPTLPKPPAGI